MSIVIAKAVGAARAGTQPLVGDRSSADATASGAGYSVYAWNKGGRLYSDGASRSTPA